MKGIFLNNEQEKFGVEKYDWRGICRFNHHDTTGARVYNGQKQKTPNTSLMMHREVLPVNKTTRRIICLAKRSLPRHDSLRVENFSVVIRIIKRIANDDGSSFGCRLASGRIAVQVCTRESGCYTENLWSVLLKLCAE